MIQEQISTSSLRCLDGNSGFGVVAQTLGMASNVARDVSMLSGYTHYFSAGDLRNPVVFMHVIRRSGGMDRHIVSRVADCGNDYSGRTNRIAHHLIIEELDLPNLSCGPSAILSQSDLFRTQWNDKPQELPLGQVLPNPVISVRKCTAWEQLYGDAGWAGVTAERVEKGDPISVIFNPGVNILPLIDEVLTLLPAKVRWKTTFSTFFMKSQEPPGTNKIQIKCIVASSGEMMFARLSPNTLFIDLRKKTNEKPNGKYVETARKGLQKQNITTSVSVPIQTINNVNVEIETLENNLTNESAAQTENIDKENIDVVISPITVPNRRPAIFVTKNTEQQNSGNYFWVNAIPIAIVLTLLLCGGFVFLLYNLIVQNRIITKDDPSQIKSIKQIKQTDSNGNNSVEKISKAEKIKHQQKIAAELKIAAQKIEQQRKETAIKAAEQAEIEKKQKEIIEKKLAKENDLKNKLLSLPDNWNGLGLPFSNGVNVAVLENSQFLAEVKDRLKIQYTAFVDLELETEQTTRIVKKTDNISKIEFWYEDGKNVHGNSIKKTIATIDLQNNGLNFKFDNQLQGHKTDSEIIRRLNRILLAKLKIEISGIPFVKEITLYSPAKINNIDTKKFTLWTQNGKEYLLSAKDKSPLYFDIRKFHTIHNSNEQVKLTNPKKIVPLQNSLGYITESIYKGEKGACKIKILDQKPLVLELDFVSQSLGKILNDYDNINKKINEKIKLYNEIDKKKKEAERILITAKIENEKEPIIKTNPLKNELIRFTEQSVGELNLSSSKDLTSTIKNKEKEIQIYDKNINEIDKQIKNLQTEKQKIENKISEDKSWNYIRLEDFSLYLLKPGTPAKNINNKENQLLLLEVKP
ncbi:MAG: hypothetical protein LBE18_06795 [Planctomycetaceae bacterium]|jgi:hypothetical protein|nr:hypothetical protein [Planctomycetaceae bacterium]